MWRTLQQLLARVFGLPSAAQVKALNQALVVEVSRREAAEHQLEGLKATLGTQVAERTEALEAWTQRQDALLAEAQEAQAHAEVAQQQTQRVRERFRVTFEQAATGIAHVDPQGHWVRVNQKLCDMLGYSREHLMQLTFQEVTHPDDLEADLMYLQQMVDGEISSCSFDKRYINADQEEVWTFVTVSAVHDRADRLYFICVIEDIRDRKQAEAELENRAEQLLVLNASLLQTTAMLERKNQELDQFAYIASHDLKAPLRAIANLSAWLEEDLTGTLPAENQEQLQLMRSRVHRLEGLIDGLLDYSRAGRMTHKIETVNVVYLVQEIAKALAPPPGFEVVIEPHLPVLQTHQLPLQRVFSNLISNAIKYCDRTDGKVVISCQPHQQTFSVTDNGPGIAPEYQERIFGMFQTLQARDKIESTGIGLAIVKKLVEAEGGEIWVESPPEQGTTFLFTWPSKDWHGLG
ncbi:Phytochrome-like protein cph1 [Acaryochloris thomasi RCC1774]|uniref:histidine kinase n=1 Tax=Acaryochloris thomasi RCC1774 TaxID=1764569 RepID=A0A2W1JJJ0_9CYAN|nr:ATP-binding protein [Acaryochloris thomasi]PZD71212.1 Phytochrome-like protein cph1 [Acaryochloris thomasi RCC1774]